MKKIATIAALLCVATFAQSTFTDPRDKQKYKTVKIGNQTWFAENLNFNAKGSKCYGEGGLVCLNYFEDGCSEDATLSKNEIQSNCKKYGRLYTQKEAAKGCPSGWHLPTVEEWNVLVNFVGGEEVAGKKLKAKNGWNNYHGNKSGSGDDAYGFTALPGGYLNSDMPFEGGGSIGHWWVVSEEDIYSRSIMSYDSKISGLNPYADMNLYSVRCIKD